MSQPSVSSKNSIERIAAQAIRTRTGVPGARVSWHSWGSGPTTVLLHGNYGSWTHWIANIEPLAGRRRLLIPDLPGFGDSDLPSGIDSIDALAGHLASGLDGLLAPGEALTLAGFSFGTLVAPALAARLARPVRHLVLISAGRFGLPRAPIPAFNAWRGLAGEAREAAHRRNLEIIMFHDPTRIDARALAVQEQNTPRRRLRSEYLDPTPPALWLQEQTGIPVTAIWGAGDRTIGPFLLDRPRYMASLAAPARTVILPATGHWLQYESAALCNRLLDALLPDRDHDAPVSTGEQTCSPGRFRHTTP